MAKSKLGRKAAYFSLHFHMAVQHGRLDRNLKKPLGDSYSLMYPTAC